MLAAFRTAAKTWVVKLLFALLALSFVAWGVGDVVRGGLFGHGPAIEVGDTKITAAEVNLEFKREVDRLQPMFGGKLTADDARKLGLMDRTIDSLVTRTLIDEAARRLGLDASEESVVKRVAADPAFRNQLGQFDRDLMRRVLARNGMGEKEFLRIERSNTLRGQMAEALTGGVSAPTGLVDPLVRWREERRVAETITIRDDSVPAPAAPEQAAVEQYYKDHAEAFMAPEFRALTVLLLRPADVAAGIEVTPDMVAEAYQSRLDEFRTPARRQVAQVVLSSQEAADKAAGLAKSGKDLAAIAKELNVQVVDLGQVEKRDLPEDLAEPVFAAQPGAIAQPVQTSLGWHLFKVGQATPERVRQLADVKAQLEQDLRRDKALDRLSETANQVEDALGGGATVEEAANRFGLHIQKVPAVDSTGKGPNGKPVADLPKTDSFLDVAFHTEQGTESQLTEIEKEGFFLLRVDAVTPPQPRPLAEVRADVVARLAAERRHAAAQEKALKLAEAIRAGDSADKAAASAGLKAVTSQPFTREEATRLPPQAVAELFKGQEGSVAVAAAADGWVVTRLQKVVPFEAAAAAPQVQATSRRTASAISTDLVDQYIAALNAELGVKVDRSQLSREE